VTRVQRWWRDKRSRLLAIYVALVLLAFGVWVWPGGFDSPSAGELVFWIVVYAILIALMARGSRLAEALLLLVGIGFLLSATVVASTDELLRADVIAFVVVVLAQSAVLVSLLLRRPAESAAPGA